MLRRMSWRQMRMWLAYSQIEPFGEERADLRVAILSSLTANINRDSSKRPDPFTPSDFMPRFVLDNIVSTKSSSSRSRRDSIVTQEQWRESKEWIMMFAGNKSKIQNANADLGHES